MLASTIVRQGRHQRTGSTAQPFLRGIEYVGGGLLIIDLECESTVTHIDIAGTAG